MEHADAQFNARLEHYNNTVSLVSWLDDLIKMWAEWLKSFYLTLKRIAFCGPLANTLMEHQQQKWMLMSPSPDVMIDPFLKIKFCAREIKAILFRDFLRVSYYNKLLKTTQSEILMIRHEHFSKLNKTLCKKIYTIFFLKKMRNNT